MAAVADAALRVNQAAGCHPVLLGYTAAMLQEIGGGYRELAQNHKVTTLELYVLVMVRSSCTDLYTCNTLKNHQVLVLHLV